MFVLRRKPIHGSETKGSGHPRVEPKQQPSLSFPFLTSDDEAGGRDAYPKEQQLLRPCASSIHPPPRHPHGRPLPSLLLLPSFPPRSRFQTLPPIPLLFLLRFPSLFSFLRPLPQAQQEGQDTGRCSSARDRRRQDRQRW